ncbi:hypothetical protein MRX96_041765 [Rhipicephalus microplus]
MCRGQKTNQCSANGSPWDEEKRGPGRSFIWPPRWPEKASISGTLVWLAAPRPHSSASLAAFSLIEMEMPALTSGGALECTRRARVPGSQAVVWFALKAKSDRRLLCDSLTRRRRWMSSRAFLGKQWLFSFLQKYAAS